MKKEDIVVDYRVSDGGSASVNSANVDVMISDSSSRNKARMLTPEQIAEVKKKTNQVQTDKYFALKVVHRISVFFVSYFMLQLNTTLYYDVVIM